MTSTTVPIVTPPALTAKSLAGSEIDAQLQRFPPRSPGTDWPTTRISREEVLQRLERPPFKNGKDSTHQMRMVGARLLLRWLETFEGKTWQQRWNASPGSATSVGWTEAPLAWGIVHGRRPQKAGLGSGLLALVCADVIRPSMPWLASSLSPHLREAIEAARDPRGFTELRDARMPGHPNPRRTSKALKAVARILAAKGGGIGHLAARLLRRGRPRRHRLRVPDEAPHRDHRFQDRDAGPARRPQPRLGRPAVAGRRKPRVPAALGHAAPGLRRREGAPARRGAELHRPRLHAAKPARHADDRKDRAQQRDAPGGAPGRKLRSRPRAPPRTPVPARARRPLYVRCTGRSMARAYRLPKGGGELMMPSLSKVADRVLERFVPKASASADTSWWEYCYCTADWRKIYRLCHVVGGRTSCGKCENVRYIGC